MTEQSTETPSPSPAPANEYEALKAAVEAANAEAPDTGRAEDPPKPPTLKKPESPPPDAPKMGSVDTPATGEEDLPKIAKLLKAREEARKTEIESKKAADSLLENAKREAAKFLEEARAAAKKELEEQRETYTKNLKANPYKFIQDHGLDREQLINEVAREGTPEWQMMKRQEATIDELRSELKELKAFREDYKKQAEESRINSQKYAIQQIEKQFLGLTTLDLAPNLRKLYDDSEILQKGHALARRLREETGEDASLEDLRDQLEYEAKKRVASWEAPKDGAKSANKKPANGMRTLSGTSQSERRAVPKTYREAKTPEEENALLEEVAGAAMKDS